jgi:hypothetical protein
MNAPTITAPSSVFDAFVLAHLRRARVRARLILNHIDAAGIALRGGLTDGEGALGMVAEAGLLGFVTERSSHE